MRPIRRPSRRGSGSLPYRRRRKDRTVGDTVAGAFLDAVGGRQKTEIHHHLAHRTAFPSSSATSLFFDSIPLVFVPSGSLAGLISLSCRRPALIPASPQFSHCRSSSCRWSESRRTKPVSAAALARHAGAHVAGLRSGPHPTVSCSPCREAKSPDAGVASPVSAEYTCIRPSACHPGEVSAAASNRHSHWRFCP